MKKKVNQEFLSTESVSAGHPDKIADQIAEAILDFVLAKDKNAHVACEVFVTSSRIDVGGEIKSNFKIDETIKNEIKDVIWTILKEDLRYDNESWEGLEEIKLNFYFNEQSCEIDQLVSKKKNHIGAGDNSTVFGYANNNYQYFPPFQTLANQILKQIHYLRKNNPDLQKQLQLAPDGKIQIIYEEDKLQKIVLCQQFLTKIPIKKVKVIKNTIKREVIMKILKKLGLNSYFELQLIPFYKGGPKSDTGLTGRKNIVDNYGTITYHGGGSFAGKDPSKTDKTLALFARFIAKHLVALGLLDEVTIQITSTIGECNLVNITCINSENANKEQIKRVINQFFNWSVEKIIEEFKLKEQKFLVFAAYGYFGREDQTPAWEELNLIETIKKWIKKNFE